jgi:transposase-like protein
MVTMKKHYTPTFKAQIVLEVLKEEKTLGQIASEYSVHPTQVRKWKGQALEGLPQLFADERKAQRAVEAEHERKLGELYAEIGRLTTQLAWLKKKSGLEHVER